MENFTCNFVTDTFLNPSCGVKRINSTLQLYWGEATVRPNVTLDHLYVFMLDQAIKLLFCAYPHIIITYNQAIISVADIGVNPIAAGFAKSGSAYGIKKYIN